MDATEFKQLDARRFKEDGILSLRFQNLNRPVDLFGFRRFAQVQGEAVLVKRIIRIQFAGRLQVRQAVLITAYVMVY